MHAGAGKRGRTIYRCPAYTLIFLSFVASIHSGICGEGVGGFANEEDWAPMFDELGNKLDSVLGKFRQRGVITEPMIRDGLREVRRVLLEADVNYKVTRQFLERVQERALREQVCVRIGRLQTE